MTLQEFFNEASLRASERAYQLTEKHKWSIFFANSIASTLISLVLIIGVAQFIEMSAFMQIVAVGCLGLMILNMLPHAFSPSTFTDEVTIELCRELDEDTIKSLYAEALHTLEYSSYCDERTFNEQLSAIEFLLKEITSRNVDD